MSPLIAVKVTASLRRSCCGRSTWIAAWSPVRRTPSSPYFRARCIQPAQLTMRCSGRKSQLSTTIGCEFHQLRTLRARTILYATYHFDLVDSKTVADEGGSGSRIMIPQKEGATDRATAMVTIVRNLEIAASRFWLWTRTASALPGSPSIPLLEDAIFHRTR